MADTPQYGQAAVDFAQRRLRPYLDDLALSPGSPVVPTGSAAPVQGLFDPSALPGDDPAAQAALLLQTELQAAAQIGDDLRAEVDRAADALRGRFGCIAAYALLTPADQEWFDRAAGLMAAMTLLAPAISQANNGLAKLKTPEFEYIFTPPDEAEERRWAAELTETVGNIRCIRAARVQIAASINLFGAVGRTRTRLGNGRASLPAMIASLLPAGWGGDRRSLLTTGVLDVGTFY